MNSEAGKGTTFGEGSAPPTVLETSGNFPGRLTTGDKGRYKPRPGSKTLARIRSRSPVRPPAFGRDIPRATSANCLRDAFEIGVLVKSTSGK